MNAKVQIQLLEQLIPFYNAADVINVYSLAFEAASHFRTLTNQISKSAAQIKVSAHKNKTDNSIFPELENLIAISLHLANSQADTYCLEQQR